MSGDRRQHETADRTQTASDWVVRLSADDVDDADLADFDDWVSASPANAQAYDRALAAWVELTTNAAALDEALVRTQATRRQALRSWTWAAAALAAALAGVAVIAPHILKPAAPPQVYATGRGEHRTLHLADGSSVDLNAVTRITVDLRRDRRSLTLQEGEAVFDVAHDPARPFSIAAGGDVVRVVGTQFSVRRRGPDLAVTVARGVVEVAAESGPVRRLYPGERLERRAGGPATVSAASADEAFGWRAGRLVYRDRALRDVVDDLNVQYPRQVRIDDARLGETRVAGVLQLDDEAAVLRRLALLAPMSIVESQGGVVLRAAEPPRR